MKNRVGIIVLFCLLTCGNLLFAGESFQFSDGKIDLRGGQLSALIVSGGNLFSEKSISYKSSSSKDLFQGENNTRKETVEVKKNVKDSQSKDEAKEAKKAAKIKKAKEAKEAKAAKKAEKIKKEKEAKKAKKKRKTDSEEEDESNGPERLM